MTNKAPKKWLPIETLPPPGDRPGTVLVVVEGSREHSGKRWRRQLAGFARTHNAGFDESDILAIERQGDMDKFTGEVTHWLPIVLPHYPK